MTLTVVWRPTDSHDKRLNVAAPSAFVDMMRDADFSLPCTLDEEDLPVIRAMGVVYGRTATMPRDDQVPNPFREIAELIAAHGSIDLYTVA